MKKLVIFFIVFSVIVSSCAGGSDCCARDFRPGEAVPEEYVEKIGSDAFFSIVDIPDSVFALMHGKSYKAECTVPRCELKYITCLHRDAEGRILMGEMVVNAEIAEITLSIFRKLYDASYPIERMVLIDNYNAEDEASMEDNNSSAFNFRFVSHTAVVSAHGKGLAIDINPLYNPYHKHLKDGTEVIEPSTAGAYLDRKAEFPYKINEGDLCCRLFLEAGFQWGGSWKNIKDYQHFEYKGSGL